jgi:hypothetical protein
MATILKAGNVATGAQITSDATGILEIRTGTGSGTTAITVGTDQAVTMAGAVSSSSLTVNSNNISAVNSLGFRNRIINGAMVIDQRNAGASVTPAAFSYTLDRWRYYASQASKATVQQNAGSVTPPVGFSNYLGVTSSSAYSVLTNDYFGVQQFIEGFNFSDMAWGTANAQTVTLSFWVRSSLTGTFGGALLNSAETRSYPFSYTISSANTWEYKTVTIAGDTTGTWIGATNGIGLKVNFSVGNGSFYSGTAGAWTGSTAFTATGTVNVVATNGATFYITGVQLEAGSVATPFERRDYGRELAMCQRYFQLVESGVQGPAEVTTACYLLTRYIVDMRATPTAAPTAALNIDDNFSANFTQSSASITSVTQGSTSSCRLRLGNLSGLTQGRVYGLTTSGGKIQLSSEL